MSKKTIAFLNKGKFFQFSDATHPLWTDLKVLSLTELSAISAYVLERTIDVLSSLKSVCEQREEKLRLQNVNLKLCQSLFFYRISIMQFIQHYLFEKSSTLKFFAFALESLLDELKIPFETFLTTIVEYVSDSKTTKVKIQDRKTQKISTQNYNALEENNPVLILAFWLQLQKDLEKEFNAKTVDILSSGQSQGNYRIRPSFSPDLLDIYKNKKSS